jgi:hypothetical protein
VDFRTLVQSSAFKYGIVLVTMPVWLPFLKALWTEANLALREEGGLLGRMPSRAERKRMRLEPKPDLSMHSEPLPKRGGRRGRGAGPGEIPGRRLGAGRPARGEPTLRSGR